MTTLTAKRIDRLENRDELMCDPRTDATEIVAKTHDAPKWGPAYPVTSRTAFISVRGLA